ncbi:MAG: reverse transcriptase N-terminal domain-containing protein [Cyanobacteria bacterium P01_F01_bin.150]
MAVKRVTQDNAGKKTAGVDGYRVSQKVRKIPLFATRDNCYQKSSPHSHDQGLKGLTHT